MSKPIDSLDEVVRHMVRVQTKLAKQGVGIEFSIRSFPVPKKQPVRAPQVSVKLTDRDRR